MSFRMPEPAFNYADSFGNKDESDSTKTWSTKVGNVIRHPLLVDITRDIEMPDRYTKPASSLSDTNLERINQENFKRASEELATAVEVETKLNLAYTRQVKIRAGDLIANDDDFPFREAVVAIETLQQDLQNAVEDRYDATQRMKDARKAANEDVLGRAKNNHTKAPGLIWEESGNWFTNWSHAPHYMHDLMPDKQDPKTVYREICDK